MLLLRCQGIAKNYGDLKVLKKVDLSIGIGEKIGLVGCNGAGKTTLANIIFGKEKCDQGTITYYKQNLKIGYLLQATSYTENNFNDMLKENYNQFEIGNFFEVTSWLGLDKVQEWDSNRFSGLSGGERTKLALANIWVTNPDLLILDEPTNHMDFTGVEWLITELNKFRGAVLVISHDRYFLDQVVNRIVELEDGKINNYYGNYSYYREEKIRRYENQMHQYEVQKKEEKKLEEEIVQLKQWAKKANKDAREKARRKGVLKGGKEFYRVKAKKLDRRVKSKIKQLEKLKKEGISKPKEEPEIIFEFNRSNKRGRRIIEVKNLKKSYGDKILFRDSSFYILYGDRIALFGPNGCGKTTLIKILLGEEKADSGSIWVSPSVKIGYLSQDVLDLNEEETPLEAMKTIKGNYNTEVRTLLANMGFDEAMLKKPIGQLSLGERTRIKLADLILQNNEVLILDEPTNHLDLYTRTQLEKTLEKYNGTIILVSHDRYFLEKISEKLLVFQDGKVNRLEKGFKEYIEKIEDKKDEDGYNIGEEKMVIETKMAYLVSELSKLSEDDPEYARLDEEYKQLVKKRNSLK
ncbi:ribosomal protection-like ABC-F family protein [Anoxybacter fermentans]|uniref:ribosomal protection-like ABC-F family protein n=1 Tax=Anoxybacter fermentans TaxID=1323375 RepID=UPI00196B9228|nr:ABC-F type ribosomal protection protein [Anoxybacter fermentans]